MTAILYLNSEWTAADGGVLRVYPHQRDTHYDIEPIANRLVLFWSDFRCPHEVMPANADRYAVSFWYHDGQKIDPD